MTTALRARMAAAGRGRLETAPSGLSGLQLWLKADALSLSDNDPVTTWTDSSGSGLDAAQATAGAKPTYKTAIFSGKPVVRFDGTTDTMTCPAFSVGLTQPTTTIVVIQTILSGISGSAHIVSSTTTGGFQAVYMTHPAKQFALYAGNTLQAGVSDSPVILAAVFNGGSSRISRNGITTSGAGGDGGWGQVCLGANNASSEFFPGDMAEVAVWNRALGADEELAVIRHLGTKYGITVP